MTVMLNTRSKIHTHYVTKENKPMFLDENKPFLIIIVVVLPKSLDRI
jgi:hypothetical protein